MLLVCGEFRPRTQFVVIDPLRRMHRSYGRTNAAL